MCHAARQLSDGLHLLALGELGFERLEFCGVMHDGDKFAVGTVAAQRHLQEQIVGRVVDAQHLCCGGHAAGAQICQPFADRAPQPFQQVAKPPFILFSQA